MTITTTAQQQGPQEGPILPCGLAECQHPIHHHSGARCEHVGCPPHRYQWAEEAQP